MIGAPRLRWSAVSDHCRLRSASARSCLPCLHPCEISPGCWTSLASPVAHGQSNHGQRDPAGTAIGRTDHRHQISMDCVSGAHNSSARISRCFRIPLRGPRHTQGKDPVRECHFRLTERPSNVDTLIAESRLATPRHSGMQFSAVATNAEVARIGDDHGSQRAQPVPVHSLAEHLQLRPGNRIMGKAIEPERREVEAIIAADRGQVGQDFAADGANAKTVAAEAGTNHQAGV